MTPPAKPSAERPGAREPKEMPAHQIVEALFHVIVEEAERNERFAKRLMSVYPEVIVARTSRPKKSAPGFDVAEFHAVNILRNHGEAMLRGRLSSLRTKADLKHVAKRSGLKLTGKALKKSASLIDIIDGIVEAAQHYVAQRGAAKK